MQPILQMHPHAEPALASFDPLAAQPPRVRSVTGTQHGHGLSIFGTYQQAFPIRTSQPHHHLRPAPAPITPYASAPSYASASSAAEHHLRRKTPNGTINAGYDGSPAPLSPGPPPSKHTVLHTPAAPGSYFALMPPPSQHLMRQPYPLALHSPSRIDKADPGRSNAAGCSFNGDFVPRLPHLTDSSSHAHAYQAAFFPNVCAPFARPGEYNVRAFCPPPGAVNDPLLFGTHGWQSYPSPWGSSGDPSNPEFWMPNHHQPANSFEHASRVKMATVPYDSYQSASAAYADARFSHPGTAFARSNSTPCLPSELNLHPRASNPQSNFNERALLQAQKAYIDALAYLQATKRASRSKAGSNSHISHNFMYPKPPKPSRGIPPSFHGPGESKFADLDRLGHAANPQSGPTHEPSDSGFRNIEATMPSSASTHGPDSLERPSPIANSRTCLEVIQNLCEQSDWTWEDGILVGGCLHYALEQYEDALSWFSRLFSLNPSYAEALTNMAATLYRLGRQSEAEHTWLRAVKLHPQCLESSEHLVGLMYKKRSKEAVEVINYVQQALKLPSTRMPHEGHLMARPPKSCTESHSRHVYGFGSSGYAIHGSENGRLLALIHAKGTMLYSLKDTQKASEAFEEVVLIGLDRRVRRIRDLIRHIQSVLSPPMAASPLPNSPIGSLQPMLLPPERARHTANLCFVDSGGELPGLVHIANGPAKRAAVQTISNSLLSLAKIMQDAISSGSSAAGCVGQPSGVGGILALYYLSLSLQESPSTANNVGILLAGVQQMAGTSSCLSADTDLLPRVPGIVTGSGLSLALSYYQYGLRLDPKHVHLHTNLGSLLKDIGQLDLAIQMYERAVSCDETFDIALTNLANAVKDKGRICDAIGYYKRAVASNPDFAEAVCGLFTALNSVCDWRGRGGVALEGGKYDRWHVDDEGRLVDALNDAQGRGLTRRVSEIVSFQLKEASRWGVGTLQDEEIMDLVRQLRQACVDTTWLETMLRGWAGKPWEGSRLMRLVERATRVLLWKQYRSSYVSYEGKTAPYRRPRLPSSLTVPSAPTVLPFHTFTTPLQARDIRAISQRNAVRISCSTYRAPWLSPRIYAAPPPPSPQLNVGYVSSDFNNHPLAHLMQSVFGFHNRLRVHAICYATTPSDGSVYRQQIEREAPVFRDVNSWSTNRIVEQIVRDKVHILVNLNGYTRGARNEVFAARPAPVQMSFMGFAGTLGAEWCDYILADETAVPACTLRPWRDNVSVEDVFRDDAESDQGDWVYSENMIFCRDTFFCCDHAQSCDGSERASTWTDDERSRWEMRKRLFPTLSDDAIILGNFNQLYKIEPTTFRCWLRILARVPKAVLWLLRFPEPGEGNLRRAAEQWAGAEVAGRLIFTDVAPKNQHVCRAKVCDLFLDTPECNAHTTAADVLWSSTPILTLPRYPYKMCSRIAASILKGALPKTDEGRQVAEELIAKDEAEYEQSGIELAGGSSYAERCGGYRAGHGRLAEMRRILWSNRWNCGLFDTRRWVCDVEKAYEEAWRRWVAGEGGDIYL